VESIRVPRWRDRNFTTPDPPFPPHASPTNANGTTSAVQATEGSSSAIVTEESVATDDQLPSTQEGTPDDQDEESEDDNVATAIRSPRQRSLLRIRDFNPYSFTKVSDFGSETLNEKGKHKSCWRAPRLVTETSKTSAKGVFTRDIESSLPYMEVVSEDTFDVTDVMMDDCRLLLLKVGFFFLVQSCSMS
jgi:hypothetical protein